MLLVWLIYANWVALVVYLTVVGLRAKKDTQTNLGQSLILSAAILAAFVLLHVPGFDFVNFAPVNPVLSSIGLILTVAGTASLSGHVTVSVGTGAKRSPLRKGRSWWRPGRTAMHGTP
jgi:hypothetical protein